MRIPCWRGPSVLGLLILAVLALAPATALGAPQTDARYIVVFKDSVASPGKLAHAQVSEADGDMTAYFRTAVSGYAAILPKDEIDDLRNDLRVKYVTVDRRAQIQAQKLPTGVQRTFASANKALDIDEIDDQWADADVAVIDTGIASHPDLNLVARTNCVGGTCVDNTGTDGNSHGTHVAGTVGALDNGFGVVGVAPGARLWAVKVLSDAGYGYESEITKGVEWVTAHSSEIDVANMSLGCECAMPTLNTAIYKSIEAGVVYVVAAGNDGKGASSFTPANNADVITVSAEADYDGNSGGNGAPSCGYAGPDDTLASFSNWGSFIDIAAPGVCIASTVPGTIEPAFDSGTSMAAPHVAGAAALLTIQSNPSTKAGVEALRNKLVAAGNYGWTDTSPDGVKEPLLDLSNETTFELTPTLVASTNPATGVSETGATLQGTISPNGSTAKYHYEFGTTTAYGTNVPVVDETVGGSMLFPVPRFIGGLTSGTVYHYRLVATNSKGTVKGVDREFRTKGWYVASTPNPAGSTSTWLKDVSCYSASGCMAGGSSNPGLGAVPLALSFEGGTWAEKVLGSGWTMESVSCAIVPWHPCMGVGKTSSYRWNEIYFLQYPFQIPSGATEFWMRGVSCDTPSHCVAAGSYVNGAGVRIPAIEVWNGTAWSVQAVPTPGGFPTLYGVSCTSSSFCMAVGLKSAASPIGSFAMAWNGTSWNIQTVPAPAGANNYALWDVSCASATKCLAVGQKTVNQQTMPYAIAWNGTTWSELVPKNPGSGELWSASCGPTTCTVVGRWIDSGLNRPLMEVWNGSEWTLQTLPVPSSPAGAVGARLYGVSCVAESCTGAGAYWDTTGAQANVWKTYVVQKQQ